MSEELAEIHDAHPNLGQPPHDIVSKAEGHFASYNSIQTDQEIHKRRENAADAQALLAEFIQYYDYEKLLDGAIKKTIGDVDSKELWRWSSTFGDIFENLGNGLKAQIAKDQGEAKDVANAKDAALWRARQHYEQNRGAYQEQAKIEMEEELGK